MCAFSPGGLQGTPESNFPDLAGADANRRLKLLWLSCGKEDGLIGFARGLSGWLKQKGVTTHYLETPGRHAWMVWRRNLADFASFLF